MKKVFKRYVAACFNPEKLHFFSKRTTQVKKYLDFSHFPYVI